MSGDPKQEYLSDGISEELLNEMSRLNDLQVVARTSSFSFKGQNVDISIIAQRLNVGTILEGSVRRTGNTVHITVMSKCISYRARFSLGHAAMTRH
jgi:TolB-like protein